LTYSTLKLVTLALALAMGAGGVVLAQDQPAEAPEPAPEFTAEFMSDPANAAAGKAIWDEQCTHCHGRKAYPGKAPKLQPKRYKPDFVWDRVSNGFRGMPPWKDVYSPEERKQIVAWVLNRKFSP
jgi:mono/diheme cytochrome c family protein